MITTINEFKQTLNENNIKISKNMTFDIDGIKYTINDIEGNLIYAVDGWGNKKMYNSQYLLKDGVVFQRPKRKIIKMLSDNQYIQALKDASTGSPNEEGYDHSELHDIAQSIITDLELKKKLIQRYTLFHDENYTERDLLEFLTDEIANYQE